MHLQPNEWENTWQLESRNMSKSFEFIKRFSVLIFIHEFIMKQADLNARKLSEPLTKKVIQKNK